MNSDSEFIKYAMSMFESLKWLPARPEDCERPDIIAWGNVDSTGCGCVCVIDPLAKLFKIEQLRRSFTELFESKCVVHYSSDMEAIERFSHYMDATGAFYKDGWLANAKL